MIVLNILRAFVDAGFGAALVQRKEITRTDVSTVFYLNVGIALGVVVFLISVRHSIASYFQESELAWVVPTLSLGLLIASFGQAQVQMLSRTLNFKLLTRLSLPSIALGGILGITLAMFGANIWALIGQQIATNGARRTLALSKHLIRLEPPILNSYASCIFSITLIARDPG